MSPDGLVKHCYAQTNNNFRDSVLKNMKFWKILQGSLWAINRVQLPYFWNNNWCDNFCIFLLLYQV